MELHVESQGGGVVADCLQMLDFTGMRSMLLPFREYRDPEKRRDLCDPRGNVGFVRSEPLPGLQFREAPDLTLPKAQQHCDRPGFEPLFETREIGGADTTPTPGHGVASRASPRSRHRPRNLS